ncbi:Chromosome partition protein Smc [wastewater metagenome]|uniref:Chromosome partition protein Smc n=2 Tax=unclassified sequences TaxID=12908 RepID=A0A5B8R8B3_9ZZZZ|nr:phage tail tape measure protein [Arhodomonas sp. KWT]QEA05359.1 chromosome partition protein Smc [uncultured organism]
MADRNFAVNMVIGARDRASRVLRGLNAGLGRLNNRVTQVGAALATYFGTQALSRFFSSALGSAADFEQQIDRIGAVTGATGEELDKLRAIAEEMGSTTQFTATEAAQGLEILGRAGLSASESVETLPSVLQLAQASGMQLAQAAGVVTDSLGAMGQGVDEAGRFADVLAQGARLANTDVRSLGRALSETGVQAAQMGMSAEETVGVLDALASAGIRGERAGTALRNILSQLQDPASKARRELADLGIQTSDLTEVIGGLESAGPAAQQAVLAFGREAGPALRTLLEQGQAGVAEYVAALNDAQGAAQDMADEATDNLRGALDGLSSAWDALRRTLVDPLMGPIEREIRSLADTFRDLTEGGVITRFGERLRDTFQGAVQYVKNLISEVGGLQGVLTRTGVALDRLKSQTGPIVNQLGLLTRGARVLWNVFSGVAKLVATVLVGSFAQLSKVIQGVSWAFSQLGLMSDETYEKIKTNADAAVAATKATWDSLKQDGRDIAEAFGLAGEKIGEIGDKARASLEKARAATARLKAQAAEADKAWTNTSRSVSEVNQAYIQFRQSIRDAREEAELLANENAFKKAFDEGRISQEQFNDLIDRNRAKFQELADQADQSGSLISRKLEEMGADAERFESGMTSAGKAAIANFRAIRSSGNATSAQLAAAYVAALDKIKTNSAAQAMAEELEKLRESGDVTAEHLERIGKRLAARMEEIGREGADGFIEQFDRIAGRISETDTSRALVRLRTQLRSMFLEGKVSADKLDEGLAAVAKRLDEVRTTADETIDSLGDFQSQFATADTIDELDALERKLKDAWEAGRISAEEYNDALEKVQERQSRLTDQADDLSHAQQVIAAGWGDVTSSAQVAGVQSSQAFQQALNAASRFGTGVGSVIAELQEQEDRFRAMQQAVEESTGSMEDLRRIASLSVSELGYISDETLQPLRDSISQARDQLQGLEDSAQSTLDSVRGELLRLQGRYVELERQRLDARRADIRSQLSQAQAAGNGQAAADLNRALQELGRVEQIRIEQARTREREAQQQARADRQQQSTARSVQRQGTAAQPVQTHRIELTLPSGEEVTLDTREDQAQEFIEALKRHKLRAG